MVQILTLMTIWEGLHFTGYHVADKQSLRNQCSKLRGFCLIPVPEWISPTRTAGHHYTQRLGMDTVTLRNCYMCLVQVSTHGIGNKRYLWPWPVVMASLRVHGCL